MMGLAGEIGWSRMQEGHGNPPTSNRLTMPFITWTERLWRREPSMKCDKKDLLLYAATDRHWLNGRTLQEVVKESLTAA